MNDVLEKFRYFETKRIHLQLIHVNDKSESTNEVIQQAVQKETLTILSAFAETEKNDSK